MAAPAGPTGTNRTLARARLAGPALLATALALTAAPPALAQTAPVTGPAQVAVQTPTVTIGISQASGVYTFRGRITPAVAGVRVSIARLGTDGTVTGVASSATSADGSYEILTSLPLGLASYYALTGATADLAPGRSRLYGLLVNVRPGGPTTPTVTLDVRRGSSTYVFSGQVTPGRSVPVTLARVVGGRQVGVIGSRTGPGGAYAFSVPVAPGTHAFQVLTGAVDGLAAGRSRVYGLVVPPAAGARPTAVSPVHGGTYVGVYLVLATDAADPRLAAATASARRLGYTAGTTSLGCDQGAARGLGRDPSSQELAAVLYFRTETEARRFTALHPPAEAGVVQVRTYCLD